NGQRGWVAAPHTRRTASPSRHSGQAHWVCPRARNGTAWGEVSGGKSRKGRGDITGGRRRCRNVSKGSGAAARGAAALGAAAGGAGGGRGRGGEGGRGAGGGAAPPPAAPAATAGRVGTGGGVNADRGNAPLDAAQRGAGAAAPGEGRRGPARPPSPSRWALPI